MITAVDTNVLLDFFSADPQFGTSSNLALQAAASEGRLVICEVVFAELASMFASPEAVTHTLSQLDIHFDPIRLEAAHLAGQAFRQYREAGGPRQRVIADFLIGAHASLQSNRLLTRDRSYYKTYFPALFIFGK